MAVSDNVNKRIDELYKEADDMGKWKQLAVGLEGRRKGKRGELWRSAPDDCKTADAKTAYAESHPDYLAIYNQQAEAEGEYIRLKARHDIALAAMSVWQTVKRIEAKELETLRGQ